MTSHWPTTPRIVSPDVEPPVVVPPPPPGTGTITIGMQRQTHQLYLPTSYANAARPATSGLRIDPTSASVVAELVSESGLGARPTVNTTRFSGPTFTVASDVPRVPVKFHAQPPPNYNKAQQQILVDPGVPIPGTYVNQGDSDDEMFMLELDATGTAVRAHEFWRLRPITPVAFSFLLPEGTTWSGTVSWECSNYWQVTTIATHGARSRAHNRGTYPNAPATSAGRMDSESTDMSCAATRLPFSSNNLTDEDVNRCLNLSTGLLNGVEPTHLLNLSVVYPGTSHWWPATTDDGFRATSPLQEGMRLFFDESAYTLAHINAMSVHPICRLIIWFITWRGVVVVDKAGALEIDGEPKVHDYFAGTAPSAILTGFPWGDLKLMAQLNADNTALTDSAPFPH